jgi:D-3-phosphoglycerate dehydrogenase / 2-oxoglutarate reductase
MTKVLVATDKPFAPVAVEGIKKIVKEAGYEFALLEKYPTPVELIAALADADAVIVRSDKITKEVIDAAKNLKIVVRAGAGYDTIDLDASTAKGVVVENTPGQNSNAVAELVLGMMVFHARNFFDGTSGLELMGKKLGLLAYGNVGKNVARIAKGFGMTVYACDPYLSDADIKKDGVTPVKTKEELFKTCNYVSLHIPLTDETKDSINYSLLSSMPSPAILINTARAEVVNEADLVKIIKGREDFSYLTDVEPLKYNAQSRMKGRFFATPKKMGAQTEEANINAGLAAANQIKAFFEKGDRTFQVNK